MSKNKKSFILFSEYEENLKMLSLEQKGMLLDAIFAHQSGVHLELDPLVKMAFSFIKSDLDRNDLKWKENKEKKSDAGKLGNLKKWNHHDLYEKVKSGEMSLEEAQNIAKHRKTSHCDNSESQTSQGIANVAVNVNANVNANVIKKNKQKKFVAPTFEEVQKYANEKNFTINPKTFFDYYHVGKWKDKSGEAVKSWKQKMITWQSRQAESKGRSLDRTEAILNDVFSNSGEKEMKVVSSNEIFN